MNPDPHLPGDFGLIPALFLYILFAWITRAQHKKISRAEEVAFSAFTYVAVYVLMLPIHLMIGLVIVGAGVLASPIIEAVSGFNLKAFVRTYIWVDGSILSFVWTAIIGAIGALPSMFVPLEEWIKNRWKKS